MEAHQLRVEDLVFARGEIIVRDAKGGKDRVTVLPASIVAPLREHLAKHFARFKRQRRLGEPGDWLPTGFARKYPDGSIQWGWQWVFPGNSLCKDAYTGQLTRPHQHEKVTQRAVQSAVRKAGDLSAGELPHRSASFRDSFARSWARHSYRAGIVGAYGRSYQHALHSCHGPGGHGCDESFGSVTRAIP